MNIEYRIDGKLFNGTPAIRNRDSALFLHGELQALELDELNWNRLYDWLNEHIKETIRLRRTRKQERGRIE